MRFVDGDELYDVMIQLIAKMVDNSAETVFTQADDGEGVEVRPESLDRWGCFRLGALFERAPKGKIRVTALAHRLASEIIKLP